MKNEERACAHMPADSHSAALSPCAAGPPLPVADSDQCLSYSELTAVRGDGAGAGEADASPQPVGQSVSK